MGNPSYPQLTFYGRRFCYALMSPLTVGEMTDPAAEKGQVERRDSKQPQQERPKVPHDRGSDADKDGAQNES